VDTNQWEKFEYEFVQEVMKKEAYLPPSSPPKPKFFEKVMNLFSPKPSIISKPVITSKLSGSPKKNSLAISNIEYDKNPKPAFLKSSTIEKVNSPPIKPRADSYENDFPKYFAEDFEKVPPMNLQNSSLIFEDYDSNVIDEYPSIVRCESSIKKRFTNLDNAWKGHLICKIIVENRSCSNLVMLDLNAKSGCFETGEPHKDVLKTLPGDLVNVGSFKSIGIFHRASRWSQPVIEGSLSYLIEHPEKPCMLEFSWQNSGPKPAEQTIKEVIFDGKEHFNVAYETIAAGGAATMYKVIISEVE